nr:hypothetical protein Iba_chr06bCG1890 [Ipomoea batatas]
MRSGGGGAGSELAEVAAQEVNLRRQRMKQRVEVHQREESKEREAEAAAQGSELAEVVGEESDLRRQRKKQRVEVISEKNQKKGPNSPKPIALTLVIVDYLQSAKSSEEIGKRKQSKKQAREERGNAEIMRSGGGGAEVKLADGGGAEVNCGRQRDEAAMRSITRRIKKKGVRRKKNNKRVKMVLTKELSSIRTGKQNS